jgi:hypothetical protein
LKPPKNNRPSTGFPELSQDDQLILIKIGFFEVWLGHVTRMINAAEGTLTLSDGATISRQQLDSIFDVSQHNFLISSSSASQLIVNFVVLIGCRNWIYQQFKENLFLIKNSIQMKLRGK